MPPTTTRVVAISGPSGTGKSTLSSILESRITSANLTCTTIHQDSYFKGPKPESYWTQEPKESPETIDMHSLHVALVAAVAEGYDVCIIEGFLLLQDLPIMEEVTSVLFLHSDASTCLARRLARSERTEHESEGLRIYFQKHVWPGYEINTRPALQALRDRVHGDAASGRPQKKSAPETTTLVEIDGTLPLERVTSAAVDALPTLLPDVDLSRLVRDPAPSGEME